jgi:pimeloyl-ACP methyl ester carboxylesterase
VIGERKLYLWGVSYGTQVMSLYATLFPAETGLFVVDSNVLPMADLPTLATDVADNLQRRLNYLVYTCKALNDRTPGACPVPDMDVYMEHIGRLDPLGGVLAVMISTAQKAGNWNVLGRVCEGAAEFAATGSSSKYLATRRNIVVFNQWISMFNKLHVQQDPSAITFGSECLNKVTTMLQHPTTLTANTNATSSSSGSVSDLFSDWIDVLGVSVRQFKQIEFLAIQ